jgi:hypothetical protein
VTEAELMARIRDLATELHLALFWPGPVQTRCWGAGYPDLTIVGMRVLFREVKGDNGIAFPRQTAWGYALRGAGQDWSLWCPADWESGRIERELKEICR